MVGEERGPQAHPMAPEGPAQSPRGTPRPFHRQREARTQRSPGNRGVHEQDGEPWDYLLRKGLRPCKVPAASARPPHGGTWGR